MKLEELKPVLWSQTGQIQPCIIYDWRKNEDIAHGCSAEYAINNYGERTVRRICSCAENGQDYIVIEVV